MRLLPLVCLVACAFAGCHDSSFDEPQGSEPPPGPNKPLKELRAEYAGKTYLVTSDVVVTGIVTTSDRSENFYRTLCIEQQGGAIEIMAGIDHLHNSYPLGCRVTLSLKGLAVGMSRGVLQAGRMPAAGSGYATDYLGSPAAVGAALRRNGEAIDLPEAVVRTIGELKPEMGGMLVRIEGVRYAPEDLSPGTWEGYKRFTDAQGEAIRTYVRPYAAFAQKEVPAGVCSLTGIVQYDGSAGYLLKLRDGSDCAY